MDLDYHDIRDLVITVAGGLFVFLLNRAVNKLDKDIEGKADIGAVAHLDDKLDTFMKASHDAHTQTQQRLDMIIENLIERRRP